MIRGVGPVNIRGPVGQDAVRCPYKRILIVVATVRGHHIIILSRFYDPTLLGANDGRRAHARGTAAGNAKDRKSVV